MRPGSTSAGTVLPFDDRAVTAAALARRGTALGRRRGGPVMIPLTLAEIAALTGGSLAAAPKPPRRTVTGPVIIDSRQVTHGALFAALPGERADGHDYARRRGRRRGRRGARLPAGTRRARRSSSPT